MLLLDLPNELLLLIVEFLSDASDLHSLICSNSHLSLLLTPTLRRTYATHKKHAMSALFYAAATGDQETTRLILESGPPLTVLHKIGGLVMPAICSAPKKCPDTTLDQVIEHGARIQLTPQWEPEPPLMPSKVGPPFSGTFPALHWAALKGKLRTIEMLLDKGVDPNEMAVLNFSRWVYGWTFSRRHYAGHTPYRWYYSPWWTSVAPLHIAAHEGHEDVVRLLLERGADIGADGPHRDKAIHLAAQMGHEGVVRLLLEKGANVNEPDASDCLALEGAALFEHEGVVRLLLENGGDVNYRVAGASFNVPSADYSGARRTVLHNLVLKVNSAQRYKHWSAKRKRILRFLLENGADPTIPDRSGMSVRYIAQVFFEDMDLARVLSEEYPWHGVGLKYWQSRLYGRLEEVNTPTEPELRKQRKQHHVEWRVRRWCRRRKKLVGVSFVRVYQLLGAMFIGDKE